MEIIIGKTAGFCYGVKRAVDGAKNLLDENDGKAYCLGEIVHNKDVINSLKNKGLQFIEDIENANGITLIRAHGVSKEIYERAKKMNIQLEDFTCPNVIKIHEIAQEYARKRLLYNVNGIKKSSRKYCYY